MNKIKINPMTKKQLEDIGLAWHTDNDGSHYIADEMVVITQDEAEAYYKAGNEVYDMFIEAGEYVIENNLLHEIGIPFNLVDIVKMSWENDVHWHLYGRFDFAGGINNSPIKLLEFNADTPTALYESAVIQWALLKSNNMNEELQFNDITKAIGDNFKRLITMSEDISDFEEKYPNFGILFSSIEGDSEEEATTKFLQNIARDVGFKNDFTYLNKVNFSDDGVLNEKGEDFEYWFKLFPWEDIAIEEGDLALILTSIVKNQKCIMLNPAYTLMFQSKAMMKIMYDLFPDSPYLLETSYEPLKNKKQIEKKVFGREGNNSKIYNVDGSILQETKGEYGHYKSIYQEFVDLDKDELNLNYQAGVFFAYKSCGVGFRRGDVILDNLSKFVGHIIR